MNHQQAFPAHAIAEPLCEALKHSNAIVTAPPGAGKSTVLPLALLNSVNTGRILLMQPRRVVVRSLANYLASLLGESVGQTVGYRIRGESKVSAATKLEIITEGILTRRIQHDPELTNINTIIFDEFHERSIHSDFGLALALEVQQTLRDDLRLVLMSATLDVQGLSTLLPDAVKLSSEGRMYPVEEIYTGQVTAERLISTMAVTIERASHEVTGDILAFLPGAGAIRQVRQQLELRSACSDLVIHELYGAMEKNAQMAALVPDPHNRQKVILATNIAETSLTIANIEAVVDSGLENVAVYQLDGDFTQLNQQMISQASATQRLGRAGRLRPGKCYRLWAKEAHSRLAKHASPQILLEDVTPLILDSMAWGTTLTEMALLDRPSQAQQSAAFATLETIDAIQDGHITPYGRQLATFPCHPVVAHMLVRAHEISLAATTAAAFIAALREETSMRGDQHVIHDIMQSMDRRVRARLTRQAERYFKLVNPASLPPLSSVSGPALAEAVALAFPQHLAFRNQNGTWKLANGKGAELAQGVLESSDWVAVLQAQSIGNRVVIRQYQPLTQKQIHQLYPDDFTHIEQVTYNADTRQIQARRVEKFREIILSSQPLADTPKDRFGQAWLTHLQSLPQEQWPFDERAWQWWYRLQLAKKLDLPQPQSFTDTSVWPSLNNPFTDIDQAYWLTRLATCKTWEQVRKLPWYKLLHDSLDWPQQHALETLLPTSLQVPSARSVPIEYSNDKKAVVAVKMQEMYGESQQQFVANGTIPITYSLLSPAGRPLQMTQDLGSFWLGSYREIQKEMKGRYPKHFWPDEPATAKPTTRTKKHMN